MTDQPKPTPAEKAKAKKWLSGPMASARAYWPGLATLLHSHAEEAVKPATRSLSEAYHVRDMERQGREKAEADAAHWRQARDTALLGIQVEKERAEKAEEAATALSLTLGVTERQRDDALAEVERLKRTLSAEEETHRQSEAELANALRTNTTYEVTALRKRVEELEAQLDSAEEGIALREAAVEKQREREETCCPEDSTFEEVIGSQRERIGQLQADIDALNSKWAEAANARVRLVEQARRERAEEMARSIRQARWLVWNCKDQVWWRADRGGYAVAIESAGRYSLAEALRCCELRSKRADGKPNEIVVPSPELIANLPIDNAVLPEDQRGEP